jgi:hypothetical protein
MMLNIAWGKKVNNFFFGVVILAIWRVKLQMRFTKKFNPQCKQFFEVFLNIDEKDIKLHNFQQFSYYMKKLRVKEKDIKKWEELNCEMWVWIYYYLPSLFHFEGVALYSTTKKKIQKIQVFKLWRKGQKSRRW